MRLPIIEDSAIRFFPLNRAASAASLKIIYKISGRLVHFFTKKSFRRSQLLRHFLPTCDNRFAHLCEPAAQRRPSGENH